MYKEKRKTYKISIYIGSTFKDNLTVKRNIKTCYDWLFFNLYKHKKVWLSTKIFRQRLGQRQMNEIFVPSEILGKYQAINFTNDKGGN